jgi:hypothetical protein
MKNTTEKKYCPKCDRFQDRSNFYKNKASKDGLTGYCKPCDIKNNKNWRENNKDLSSSMNINAKRLRRYKMTEEYFNKLLDGQERRCAICKNYLNEKIAIDHDHRCCEGRYSCGECVRGLLCGKCNSGLGMFNDSEHILNSAINYLTKYM